MAITKTYINGDASALTTFLESTGLFDSVTNASNTITCKDADNNTLLTIYINGTSHTITAYASATVSKSVTLGTSGSKIIYAYSCANGAIIYLDNSLGNQYFAGIAITKTNNDKVAVIFSNSATPTANAYTTYWCVAWGDVEPISSYAFTASTRNQTAIVPFLTCNDLNASSYTPNAGYIPVGQYYNMGYGTLTIGGESYLSNGYWAIKDE